MIVEVWICGRSTVLFGSSFQWRRGPVLRELGWIHEVPGIQRCSHEVREGQQFTRSAHVELHASEEP